MIGECTICNKETEVREIITVNAFVIELTKDEGDKLYTCAECTDIVLTAIQQAIAMIREGVRISS